MLAAGDFAGAQAQVLKLREPLGIFFERVLVMAEEPAARRNRLSLLQAIAVLFSKLADYSQVVVEGEKPA